MIYDLCMYRYLEGHDCPRYLEYLDTDMNTSYPVVFIHIPLDSNHHNYIDPPNMDSRLRT